MAHKSLLLKDYLELESISESLRWASLPRARTFSGGETTVRRLLETELSGGADYKGWRLIRFRSKGVLSKLSAVIRTLQSSTEEAPRAATDADAGSALSRSFSKKLRRGVWKKRGHEKEEGKVMAAAAVAAVERAFDEEEAPSGYFFYSSSPGLSKCSSESTPRTSESDLTASPTLTPQKGIYAGDVCDDNRRDQKEQCGKGMDCASEEEKEQLSPVSVMDFPYQDEDEDEEVEQPSATSPPFEQSVGNLDRTKHQLLQKIRRLESLADLEPLDLNNLFPCSIADHVAAKEQQWRLAACSLLRRVDGVDSLTDCGEKLLLDFFVEGLSCREECGLGTTSGSAGDEEMLRAGNRWFAGGGFRAERYCEEMGSGGWRRFKEEEAVVAVEITDGLLRRLMAEFVVELVSAA